MFRGLGWVGVGVLGGFIIGGADYGEREGVTVGGAVDWDGEMRVVVDHVGGKGGFFLEAWEWGQEDHVGGEDEDMGGSSWWAASRGPGPLTRIPRRGHYHNELEVGLTYPGSIIGEICR